MPYGCRAASASAKLRAEVVHLERLETSVCSCIAKWEPDPQAVGSHKMVPVLCRDVNARLAARVMELEMLIATAGPGVNSVSVADNELERDGEIL